MANELIGINPELLRWARERAGYSVENVARMLKKDPKIVRDWESGEKVPSYSQLEKLAYDVYKRPLDLFFFPNPPNERDPKKEFRTLPDFELDSLTADTLYALRQAEGMQVALRELLGSVNPSMHKIFRDIGVDSSTTPAKLANAVREYLGLTVSVQQSWKTDEEALVQWRDCIQESGIYVFKGSLKQRDISGFCLVDNEFPIIYLNNSSAVTRQIFTLFHEVAHILLEVNGITKLDESYIDYLDNASRKIEIFANQFVGDFLVPSAALVGTHIAIKVIGYGN